VKSILLLNDIVTEQLVASHFVSVVVSRSPDEWSEKLSEIAKDLIDLEKEWLRSRYPMRKFGKLVIPSSLYDLKKAEELYEKAKKILEIVAAYAEEVYGVRLID